MDGGGSMAVNVERLARELMLMQASVAVEEELRAIMVTKHRIFRVPSFLRDNNAEAYTPGFVAIGPLHSGDWRLHPAERLKVANFNSLISRGHPDPAHHLTVIKDYIRLVAAREPEARALYAADEVAGISPDDFIQMMVLDGCFIIEHLVRVGIGWEEPSLIATPFFGPTQLSVDLILAENQIPFFVLVDLISSTKLPEFEATGFAPPVLLVKLALFYLAGEKGRDMSESLPAAENVSHILHLLHEMITAARTRWEPPPRIQDGAGAVLETERGVRRLLRRLPLLRLLPLMYRILPEERKLRTRYGRDDLPPASDLKRMGVQFKRVHGSSWAKPVIGIALVMGPVPLAVKLTLEDRRLHLAPLSLESRTVPVLLNLMAFEQSSSSDLQQDVSAYVAFMSLMVQSAEDAGVLVAAEVLDLQGGTGNESMEDVARLFRVLGVAANKERYKLYQSYLGSVINNLMKRVRSRSNVQTNYFTLLAEFVAVVTFVSSVATIAQTYATFKYH